MPVMILMFYVIICKANGVVSEDEFSSFITNVSIIIIIYKYQYRTVVLILDNDNESFSSPEPIFRSPQVTYCYGLASVVVRPMSSINILISETTWLIFTKFST